LGCLGRFRLEEHIFKQDFDGHGVPAAVVGHKEFAIALELTVIEGNVVVVVIAPKSNLELVEAKALGVFRVTLGLLNFSNQTVIHISSPFGVGMKKARRQARAFIVLLLNMSEKFAWLGNLL
jgi:hypothetical protein